MPDSEQGASTAPKPLRTVPEGARRLCVAPMMDYTDRHFRSFLRLMSRRALLYTEMVPAQALLRGSPERFLAHAPAERPLALQLGGGDPADLAAGARMAEDWGYDEVNLNVGCPSDRVTAGRFGACLMADPALVARCVRAMRAAVGIPVTVKHRIGIDDRDDYGHLAGFVATLADAGCDAVIIHARKAWLTGLSPKQNRSIPPLRHELVHRIKADFPQLVVVTNGGIASIGEATEHLTKVDGVMIGRAVLDNPWLMAEADRLCGGEVAGEGALSRESVAEGLAAYVASQVAAGVPAARITRHAHGLFHGRPGARRWRTALAAPSDENTPEAAAAAVLAALGAVRNL